MANMTKNARLLRCRWALYTRHGDVDPAITSAISGVTGGGAGGGAGAVGEGEWDANHYNGALPAIVAINKAGTTKGSKWYDVSSPIHTMPPRFSLLNTLALSPR